MNKDSQNNNIEKLLKIAGHRTQPDEDMKNDVYKNVHKAWADQNKTPLYKNRFFLAAASMLLFSSYFIFESTQSNKLSPTVLEISSSITISGQAEISLNNMDWKKLDVKEKIKPGSYLKTQSNNRLLVKLTNNNVFRLDENSLIHMVDLENFELQQGQIYIESDESSIANPLLVKTPFASINHIGTHYNIKVTDNSVNVSVRNGKVLLQNSLNSKVQKTISKGFEGTLSKNGKYQQKPVTAYSSTWQWTQNIIKPFILQDQSIAQYLSWISKETGYPITWDSPKDKGDADKIKLSGSIAGLKPMESLDVILPTTSFVYQILDSEIYISR